MARRRKPRTTPHRSTSTSPTKPRSPCSASCSLDAAISSPCFGHFPRGQEPHDTFTYVGLQYIPTSVRGGRRRCRSATCPSTGGTRAILAGKVLHSRTRAHAATVGKRVAFNAPQSCFFACARVIRLWRRVPDRVDWRETGHFSRLKAAARMIAMMSARRSHGDQAAPPSYSTAVLARHQLSSGSAAVLCYCSAAQK